MRSNIFIFIGLVLSKFRVFVIVTPKKVGDLSGGELLELRLLDTHLLDTFGSKSIARHKFYQLLESS